MHVKVLICEAYTVEEISIFILYFFKPPIRKRISHIPGHNDDNQMSENLLIFSHPS